MNIEFKGNELNRKLAVDEIEKMVDLYQNNPVQPFTEIEFEPFEIETFNVSKIISTFQHKEDKSFSTSLYSGTDDWLGGSISFHNFEYNIGGIEFSNKYLSQVTMLERIKAYVKEWQYVFPEFTNASGSADNRNNEFWIDVAKVYVLPDCFGSRLGWYHVISQSAYEPCFKREDLLNAPFLDVKELDDGTICIQSYEHPLDFDTPETTEKIIEITNYLTEKWYEHDPEPTTEVVDDVIILKRRI